MYARRYWPGEIVSQPGVSATETFFIVQGQVGISVNKFYDGSVPEIPFCILPAGSYFGDYFVLNDLPLEYSLDAI